MAQFGVRYRRTDMSWIQTYTGRKFFPLTDEPGEIDLRDIAHSLALQCRFNGHCRQFYSVAEHSVRVSHILPDEEAAWGLLHDAAEAYVSDLPRPLKLTVPDFRAAEDRLLRQIAETYISGDKLSEGILNRIEHGIRTYDPCLSCSTHALGQMPMQVQLVSSSGAIMDELSRG